MAVSPSWRSVSRRMKRVVSPSTGLGGMISEGGWSKPSGTLAAGAVNTGTAAAAAMTGGAGAPAAGSTDFFFTRLGARAGLDDFFAAMNRVRKLDWQRRAASKIAGDVMGGAQLEA